MTDIEQRLIEAAKRGEWLECTDSDPAVRAGLVRELLLGLHGDLDPRGVRLGGARIEGTLDIGRVNAAVGLFLAGCTLDEPLTARYASLPDLMLYGGQYTKIDADGLRVDGDLFIREGTRVCGDHADGAIRLLGAHVTGDFDLSGSEIINTAGPALNASGLTVNGYLFLQRGIRVTGHGDEGAINLLGAHIAGNLELREAAEITNLAGAGLNADRIRVDGHLLVRRQIRITGHGDSGAVDLLGAHIGEDLEFTDVEIINTAGTAVHANRVHVSGSLFLFGQTRLSGGGDGEAISLNGGDVGGRLTSEHEVRLDVETASSPVLDLRGMTVGASVTWPATLGCGARTRRWKCENERWVRLDEFTYASLGPGWDWQRWLHLIRCHTPAYHASAYQRLAATERASGHDGTVRRILMAQQTDLRRRSPESLGGFMTRRFHWMWGVLAGYGYRARRTAAALLLVLTVAGALGWWAGQIPTRPGHLVAERVTSATAATGAPCSTVELIGLGLDRGLPLAMTGMRARCDLDTASKKGQAFTAAIWLVQLAVWGLATLALAGYTNLVRKPG